ncbi:hypothetical protein GCM10018980_15170 [Streptomyces capoamus]|uniref:Uncharacterized protein n=1 Tax=Streptomyces capoamus TaxID=68183 RepID=A0A919ETY3_9ACTN|nr:hypothetical protein GCM10010501_19370 [Streptomyces libani subsp. rufus]GHG40688.1 hypothetical protein GCM10018980_15170 [Streptomyces capoamus]
MTPVPAGPAAMAERLHHPPDASGPGVGALCGGGLAVRCRPGAPSPQRPPPVGPDPLGSKRPKRETWEAWWQYGQKDEKPDEQAERRLGPARVEEIRQLLVSQGCIR